MSEPAHLRQFLVFVFFLLIPCFVLWTLLSGLLALPAIGLVDAILTYWLPQVVDVVLADGNEALLMTRFAEQGGQLIPFTEAEDQLGFRVNTRLLSYSLPFYSALHFATPRQGYVYSWLGGMLVLYPLSVLGLLSVCLKDLMVVLGPGFMQQAGAPVPGANLIGIAYQFSVLIVPTLAPVMLWAGQSWRTPLLSGALSNLQSRRRSSQ